MSAVSRVLIQIHSQLLASACALAITPSGACAADIWVVSDRAHPINAEPGVRVIELDGPARLQAQLSAHLPSDLEQATAIVQQRLKDGGADLHRRLASAYQDVVDAWSLGIVKIPAIVVDQRYVVYGEEDVGRAVARIAQYRRMNP